jgi:hypothetical protein
MCSQEKQNKRAIRDKGGIAAALLAIAWPWLVIPYFRDGEILSGLANTRAYIPTLFACGVLAALLLRARPAHALRTFWERRAPASQAALCMLFGFTLWNLVSWAGASEPTAAWLQLSWVAAAILPPGLAIAYFLRFENRQTGLILAISISGAITGLAAIAASAAGWNWAVYIGDRLKLLFTMPAVLGGFAMIAMLCGLALFHDALLARRRRFALLCGIMLVCAFAAIYSARTLSTFAGLFAGI